MHIEVCLVAARTGSVVQDVVQKLVVSRLRATLNQSVRLICGTNTANPRDCVRATCVRASVTTSSHHLQCGDNAACLVAKRCNVIISVVAKAWQKDDGGLIWLGLDAWLVVWGKGQDRW